MKSVTIHLPLRPVSEEQYAEAQRLMDTLDRNDAPFLVLVDAWRRMLGHQFWKEYDSQMPEEIQAIRLDRDTTIVTLPHEVFVELGMTIKAASPFRTTIVISLAGDMDFVIQTAPGLRRRQLRADRLSAGARLWRKARRGGSRIAQ